jgi:hypothetical protein
MLYIPSVYVPYVDCCVHTPRNKRISNFAQCPNASRVTYALRNFVAVEIIYSNVWRDVGGADRNT